MFCECYEGRLGRGSSTWLIGFLVCGTGVRVLHFLGIPWVHVSSTFTWAGGWGEVTLGISSFPLPHAHKSIPQPSPLPGQMLQPEPEGELGPRADPLCVLRGGWGRPQQRGHGQGQRSSSSVLLYFHRTA